MSEDARQDYAAETAAVCLRRVRPPGDNPHPALGPRTAGGLPANGMTRICIEETKCP